MPFFTSIAASPFSIFRVHSALVLLALLLGCSDSSSEHQGLQPVQGVLLYKGRPAVGAKVIFHPVTSSDAGRLLTSRATTDGEGRYALSTYAASDGAPIGEYVVTLYWPDLPPGYDDDSSDKLPPDRLRGRYSAKDRSVLKAVVGDNPTHYAAIDLASAELARSTQFQLRAE